MKAFIITVAGTILSLVASLANVIWLTFLATLVALIGAYLQYRDSTPFEFLFTQASWQEVGEVYKLVIPRVKHNKSAPTVTILKGTHPNFEKTFADIRIEAGDTVVIEALLTFAGKLIIR